MKKLKKIFVSLGFFMFLTSIVSAQSGGTYEIMQSVVANGGGTSDGGSFGLTGTNAQILAGTNSTGGQFGVRAGFWQFFFAPTAALVAVSGRVTTANGAGVSRARISLTDGNGIPRTSITGSFGYFRFDDVEVGQTYIISVKSKRYQFTNQTQVVFISDEITNLNFNAFPE